MAIKSSRSITMSPLEDVFVVEREEIDLSYWEFVNNSDGDYSDDCLSVESLSDDAVSCDSSSSLSSSPKAAEIRPDLTIARSDLDLICGNGHNDADNNHESVLGTVSGFPGYSFDDRHDYEEEEEEEVDEEDGGGSFDLDDELVPKYVVGKLGRQRMRKLGKRSFSKMNNSKRSPFSQVKPGCVYGKHGLGMKFI